MNKTVLIVDDEEVILSQYKNMLSATGYNVLTAVNGDLALKLLEKNKGKVDLVLLDLMMPGISGGDVLAEVRNKTDKYDNPKILVLTNLASEETIKECFEMGANGYLIKTEVEMDGLIQEIEKMFK